MVFLQYLYIYTNVSLTTFYHSIIQNDHEDFI